MIGADSHLHFQPYTDPSQRMNEKAAIGELDSSFEDSCPVILPQTRKETAPRRLGLRQRLSNAFRNDIGIDLGTANTLVCMRDQGVVLNEPSVVAVTRGSHNVMHDGHAVGMEAKKMLGKTSYSVDVIRPLRDGVITNFPIAEAMLRYFISKVKRNSSFSTTRVVIAIPYGITNAEMKAVFNSTMRAGADRVHLIEETLAAGLGAGLAVDEPNANLVVDIGGGTTGISVISITDIAYGTTVRCAGDHMTNAVTEYVLQKFGLQIGQQTAEDLKIQLGSALPLAEEKSCVVRGQTQARRPGTVEITSQQVREALTEPLAKILRGIDWVLENTPPELAADLVGRGAVVTGGGALLPGIDSLISQHTGLNVRVADDPLRCVVHGTGVFMDSLNWRN